MYDLSSIGMKKGLLYETIITTNNEELPNAAPIGVICKNNSEVVLYLYEGTHTLENIKSNKRFVVNILRDPLIFVLSTIGELSADYFKEYKDGFFINSADAFGVFEVNNIKEVEKKDAISESKMNVVTASLEDIVINKENVQPLNRAIFAIIESLVYVSRINIVDEDTSNEYSKRIKEMSRLVTRVGGMEDKKAMNKILEFLEDD
ncbi:DUF447 domain-containing protein [Methanobacterium sp. ACI-7]|uniref:DUF447 domain-containing protein n=1 Tax=unclassified Methanobacterium TaxID=2627676 RepID=UPI0039C2BDF2